MQIQEFDLAQLHRGKKMTAWLEVAPRAGGGMWQLPLLTVTGANSGPTLTVFGAVHGNEYEGVDAIPRIFAQVEPEDLCGTLAMITTCNVPAYEAATRNSPIDGLNLARVFPGDPAGTITERIAYWLTEKLIKPSNLLIDLHSGGRGSDIPTLIGYIHTDDARGRQSEAAARAFGAPVLWGHPPPVAPGRSLSAATTLGIPSLYTETPGGGRSTPDDVACYIDGVLNVMEHLDMLPGEPQPRPMTHHLFGDGNLEHKGAVAATAGFFRPLVKLLEKVSTGQCVGTISDAFGRVTSQVTIAEEGTVIHMCRLPRVEVGTGLVQVTGSSPPA